MIEHEVDVRSADGAPRRIEWYPGVEHGFVFPQRACIYDQAAAERHWERLFSLFGRTLRPYGPCDLPRGEKHERT